MSDVSRDHPAPGSLEPAHLFALRPGTRLNEYEIVRILGHGGFGITYLATDTHLRKAVAIKEYLPNEVAARISDSSVKPKSESDRSLYEQGKEAFLNEARMLARFEHPSIVKVHRFFELHGTAYIVLDLIEGRSLETVLEEERMDAARLRSMLVRILEGLAIIHAESVLHRDIKPNNIMIRGDGTPVLIDFGSARNVVGMQSRDLTRIVSPGYSPPEQFGVGGEQGPWTDLYALGAVAYRCITQRVPPESLRRLKHDPLIPAATLAGPEVDKNLLDAIDEALRIDERARPQSAAAFRAKLEAAAPIVAKNRSRMAAILAGLALCLLAAGWMLLRPTAPREPSVEVTSGAPPSNPEIAKTDSPVPGSDAKLGAEKAQVAPPRDAFAAAFSAATSLTPEAIEDRYRFFQQRPTHKAIASAPKSTRNWSVSGADSVEVASERALEGCQLFIGTACFLIAVNERIEPHADPTKPIPREMPRFRYAGIYDPDRVPTLTPSARRRPEVVQYRAVPSPKAAALHPWGRFFVVNGAASQAEAETQVLARCNGDTDRRGRDGPCFLYASGDLVVLPERRQKASGAP